MIFDQYTNNFWHKRKIDNFDPYNVFLAIATNIPKRLKTGFVVQGHIYIYICTHITLHYKQTLRKSKIL